ncbi:hypothetical protein EB815_14850 [Mesorhizobium loti]|uniref:Uncharacterized protein n=2 Tax=Phyllobacteriaceae TaxID=69277 RepID=A0A6M7TZ44_RHILI|nr:hypothetical protein A8145_19075 [Mesorhizobium loti]QKC70274.1 hypothetical protein EB815_14850 [Mesorhizobium loti]QKC89251.1 hypothetical protein EB230_13020 [Mesorhizobium sp. NZP2234]
MLNQSLACEIGQTGTGAHQLMSNGISKMIRMSLAKAVPYVSEKLASHGFKVVQSVGMRSQKRARDGSRTGGFRVLGVSNPDVIFKARNGVATAVWCNVLLTENGDNAVKVLAVDPLPSVAASDPSAMNVRVALSRAIHSL